MFDSQVRTLTMLASLAIAAAGSFALQPEAPQKSAPQLKVEYPTASASDLLTKKDVEEYRKHQLEQAAELDRLARQIEETSAVMDEIAKETRGMREGTDQMRAALTKQFQKVGWLQTEDGEPQPPQSAGSGDAPAPGDGMGSYRPPIDHTVRDHSAVCDCDCPTLAELEEVFRRVLNEYEAKQAAVRSTISSAYVAPPAVSSGGSVGGSYYAPPAYASPSASYGSAGVEAAKTTTVRKGLFGRRQVTTVASPGESKIVMFRVEGMECSACDYAEAHILPSYVAMGYNVEISDVPSRAFRSPDGKAPYFLVCDNGGCQQLTYAQARNQ